MQRLVITLVSISALLAGLYLSAKHFAEPIVQAQPPSSGSLTGSLRPDFSLANINNELVSATDFEGKTVLINFWATWCEPCRMEMPMLMDLQRKHGPGGLQIVGIALDDQQKVKSFVETYGISYPILVGEADVFETSAAYGNTEGVLPYSVLIDNEGIIRWKYAGIIKHDKIADLLSDLL
jgi:thiol-disulfide isomerase/thioredoxin